MRSHLIGFVVLVVAVPSASAEGPFGVDLFEENLMVPMRDGVRLAVDIYRPTRDGELVAEPLPLLLQRTPYDKTRESAVEQAELFTTFGYVVALQDARGRYQSEGVFTKYIGEGADGYDTVEYLATLPYVNGKVGMWGTSYAAHAQANAAKLRPPHLETIILNMGGLSNGWDHKIRNHGAFEIQQLTWAFRQLGAGTDDPVVKKMLENEPIEDWLQALPLRKGLNPLSIAPNFEDYVLGMMTEGDYDEGFKHLDVNWVEYYEQTADVPMILISGWYDSYAGGNVENFRSLSAYLDSPVHLVMGPWTHGGNTRSYAGDVEFGPEAAVKDFHREYHIRWFDHTLKGAEGEAEAAAPVEVFVMGTGDGHRDENGRLFHGGYWKTATRWPLEEATPTRFYLRTGGELSTTAPTDRDAVSRYTYDPRDPVPTIGGSFSSTSPVFEPGAYHQAEREGDYGHKAPYLPLKARPDVLVFQTAPLDAPVEVVGPVTVTLRISSSAVDTDFTVKLIDVYPPSEDFPSGFEMNLTDAILRSRYRESPERQVLMTPGEIYEIQLEPFPTANVFKQGHRIRLDVSSSNFPRFDVNPNTGEPLGRHRRWVVAENAVYHNRDNLSYVTLPVIETPQN